MPAPVITPPISTCAGRKRSIEIQRSATQAAAIAGHADRKVISVSYETLAHSDIASMPMKCMLQTDRPNAVAPVSISRFFDRGCVARDAPFATYSASAEPPVATMKDSATRAGLYE